MKEERVNKFKSIEIIQSEEQRRVGRKDNIMNRVSGPNYELQYPKEKRGKNEVGKNIWRNNDLNFPILMKDRNFQFHEAH